MVKPLTNNQIKQMFGRSRANNCVAREAPIVYFFIVRHVRGLYKLTSLHYKLNSTNYHTILQLNLRFLSFDANNFIHSFIAAISIAPLQVLYYSEALPTTAYCVGVSRRSAQATAGK